MASESATMPTGKTITVDLGEMTDSFDARLASGAYRSADELMREALRALEREEQAPHLDDDFLREKVEEALADPSPDIPMEEVFERLERMYREDMKAKRGL
jgi:antitoxin ParD1/3/4